MECSLQLIQSMSRPLYRLVASLLVLLPGFPQEMNASKRDSVSMAECPGEKCSTLPMCNGLLGRRSCGLRMAP